MLTIFSPGYVGELYRVHPAPGLVEAHPLSAQAEEVEANCVKSVLETCDSYLRQLLLTSYHL